MVENRTADISGVRYDELIGFLHGTLFFPAEQLVVFLSPDNIVK